MPSDRSAAGSKRRASASEPARLASAGSSCRRVTLREFRKRQRQDLLSCIALTGQDRASSVREDVRRASAALEVCDVDEMVRLFGRLVGCLEAPAIHRAHHVKMFESRRIAKRDAKTQGSLEPDEQDFVRDVILQLVCVVDERGLDSNDPGTRKLLKLPFEHIMSLLQEQSLDRLVSREQWMELSRVASGLSSSLGPQPQLHFGADIKPARRQKVPHSEQSRIKGTYEPNSRVKECATVIHDASDAKVLNAPNVRTRSRVHGTSCTRQVGNDKFSYPLLGITLVAHAQQSRLTDLLTTRLTNQTGGAMFLTALMESKCIIVEIALRRASARMARGGLHVKFAELAVACRVGIHLDLCMVE
eukprot:CAMPEP_0203950064 /NCGR_PEP_ID=MMETSP0359-20131031/84308_1 /ASSEMBLY_ACC=CAM_ASM_000338 /TAXON_ID=268821 /ORGANISM="Scrippsiella Hangoei, Strain SHTV-5" /LENGTH=359 /DNA_ID=CAMNT_0050882175 /DNA_START=53 /DNA_END=1130 /DNA_ORIENTATION=+